MVILKPSKNSPTISYTLNGDLVGLTSLQCLDKFIQYSGVIGLRIVLDRHSALAGKFYNESSWSISPVYNEQRFISDWVMLAKRYAGIKFKCCHCLFFLLQLIFFLYCIFPMYCRNLCYWC